MDAGPTAHEQLLDQLPVGLAVALRLDAAGYPSHVIATAFGIPAEGVGSSLEIARGKLARLSGTNRVLRRTGPA